MSENALSKMRKLLASNGSSELITMEDQPALQEMWQEIQTLREEMNEAKKQAAAQAALPYQEVITQIEKRYAMLLRLSSN